MHGGARAGRSQISGKCALQSAFIAPHNKPDTFECVFVFCVLMNECTRVQSHCFCLYRYATERVHACVLVAYAPRPISARLHSGLIMFGVRFGRLSATSAPRMHARASCTSIMHARSHARPRVALKWRAHVIPKHTKGLSARAPFRGADAVAAIRNRN